MRPSALPADVTPKFVSPSDPAAQWTGAMRGPAFFAYADNYLIDVKFGIIMDVEASRAIRQAEVGAAKTMIERTEERFGFKPERLAADTAYGSAPTLNWLVNEKGIAPHIPVIDKSKREDGTFSREDFTFDKARDLYICPAGKALTTTGTVSTDHAMRYIAPVPVCRACPLNRNAARTCPLAGSCATSTRMPATWLERSPRLRPSSNRAVTASASRCCSPISSAFSGSGGSACAGPAAHKTSSHLQPSRRTCGASPSWRLGRPRCPPRALRKRRVRQCSVSTPTLLPERTATRGFETPVSPLRALPIPDFCNKICHSAGDRRRTSRRCWRREPMHRQGPRTAPTRIRWRCASGCPMLPRCWGKWSSHRTRSSSSPPARRPTRLPRGAFSLSDPSFPGRCQKHSCVCSRSLLRKAAARPVKAHGRSWAGRSPSPGGDWRASALNHAVFRGDARSHAIPPQRAGRELEGAARAWRQRLRHAVLWAPCNEPVDGGDWLGCAEALVAHGMPAARPDPEGSGDA